MDAAEGFVVHWSVKSYLACSLPADRLPESVASGNYALLDCEHSHCISARRGPLKSFFFSPQCSTEEPRPGSSVSSGPPGTRKGLLLTACHGSVSSEASQPPEAPSLGTATMGPSVLHISLLRQTSLSSWPFSYIAADANGLLICTVRNLEPLWT